MATGLFDMVTPQQAQQAYLDQFTISPQQMGQQGLLQQVVSQMGNAGAGIGAGVGRLFGGMSPQEAEAQRVQGIMSGVDMTSSEGLLSAANRFSQVGDVARAQALMGQADKVQQVEQAKAEQARKAGVRQQQVDLVSTRFNLSPEQAEAVVASDPKIVAELFKPQTAKSQTEFEKTMDSAGITDPAERQKLAGQHLANKLNASRGDPTAIKALEIMSKQLDIQSKQQKIDLAKEKAIQQQEAAANAQKAKVYKSSRVIDTVDKAISQVGGFTAGLGGAIAKNIPGSEAVNLESNLATIKANLGFDELQAMRDASPTGGALGQVAVQELEALQSTVASLVQKQSPEQLRENLEKIKYHYSRWLATLEGRNPDTVMDEKSDKVSPSAEDAALINKWLK